MLSKFIIFLVPDGESLHKDFCGDSNRVPFNTDNQIYFIGPLCVPPPAAADARIALVWEPGGGDTAQLGEFLKAADLCAAAYHHELDGKGGHGRLHARLITCYDNRPLLDYQYHRLDNDQVYRHFAAAANAQTVDDFDSCLRTLAALLEPQIAVAGRKLLLRLLPRYLDHNTQLGNADDPNNDTYKDLRYMSLALQCQLGEDRASVAYPKVRGRFNECVSADTPEAFNSAYNALKAEVATYILKPEKSAA